MNELRDMVYSDEDGNEEGSGELLDLGQAKAKKPVPKLRKPKKWVVSDYVMYLKLHKRAFNLSNYKWN